MEEVIKRSLTWICLGLMLIGSSYGVFLWLKSHRSPQIFGRCIHRVNTSEKLIALTFDDGPSSYTQEILNVLRAEEVPATFFVLGKNGEEFPNLIRQIYEEGHDIGNHSYSHQPLIFKSLGFIQEEIEKTDQIIKQSGYQGTIHFRAPYGRKLIGLPWILYKSKRPHILFDVIPDDWATPGVDAIVNRIVAQIQPGSIILCHDGNGDNRGEGRSQTVQAISIFVRELRAAGYQFVTISQLLKLDASKQVRAVTS